MKTFELPYGKGTLKATIDEAHLVGVLRSGVHQWESQILARILLKATVIFVSDCDERIVRDLHMLPAHDVDEAMAKARKIVGRDDYTVTVIPDGVSVIVRDVQGAAA